MERILVAGATGQLGMAAVQQLRAVGRPVRALIRNPAAAPAFHLLGAETAIGDLTQPDSLAAACRGVTHILATANAAVPTRKGDTFDAVERLGYRNLIAAAKEAGVGRFIYTSVGESRHEASSEFFRCKRETERALLASGIDTVILRAGIFMDLAFAMMGSEIPLRGAACPTALRPFSFSRNHFERVRNSIVTARTATIPGNGSLRQAFLCVDDVARCLVAATAGGPNGIHALNGPEAQTFLDIVRLYERLLDTRLKVRKGPAFVFRAMSKVLRPFNPAAANLMHLNYVAATEETFPTPETARTFGISLTTSEAFLRAKLALAP